MRTPSNARFVRPSALLACCLLALSPAYAGPAERFSGRVVGVSDGDTISVMYQGRAVKVRLEGIDCPELSQAYGRVAKLFTSEHVFGRQVNVVATTKDRYGRFVGRVYTGNEDLSKALLAAGLAWHYTEYSSDRELDATEMAARRQRVGLWSDANPTPPWVYRRYRSNARSSPGLPRQSDGRNGSDRTIATAGPFHGNVKSHLFHAPGCPNYNCANCTAVFATREQAIAQGYRPAGDCAARR